MSRLHLSPPSITDSEKAAVNSCLESGWVAPVGPEIDLFEQGVASATGRRHAIALSSGTAALHLGLKALGVQQADEVVVPTLTFGATAFAVTYLNARPVFVDSEAESWGMDPDLLEEILRDRSKSNRLPTAVVPVDIFGRTCNYERILEICSRYGVPVLADSAESLGSTFGDAPAGSFGEAGAISFNGNKIVTSGGGGAFVTNDSGLAHKVRHWATQSREPRPWYEHKEIGFNYRLSNVLAAIGRTQLARLGEFVEARRRLRRLYSDLLAKLPGTHVAGDPPWGAWNSWLTVVVFDDESHRDARDNVLSALNEQDIESRPIWKPLHRQPVFDSHQSKVTGVADQLFSNGLCLPSGSNVVEEDVFRVVNVIEATLK